MAVVGLLSLLFVKPVIAGDSAECREMTSSVQSLVDSARGQQALVDLRERLGRSATADTCPGLWDLYDKTLLLVRGRAYLLSVPKDRYRIDIEDFVRKNGVHPQEFFLLDVREPDEFAHGHLEGAVNIPFREVARHLPILPGPGGEKKIVIICRSQHRANHVLVVLRELGYTNAFTLKGGYRALERWEKSSNHPSASVPHFPRQQFEDDDEDEPEDFGC